MESLPVETGRNRAVLLPCGVDMDWMQLKSFYHIATLGSITRASEAVHRSQPAVSQQLRALEEELGFSLFERLGKQKMVLTAAGRRFFLFTEETLRLHREMLSDINAVNDNFHGRVVVSAASATLGLMLSDSVRKFKERYPHAELTLFDRHPGKGLELLREGKVDLAIALESQVPRHFCSYWWLRGHFVLMLPRGHELTRISSPGLEKISEYPFIKLIPNVRYAASHKLEQAFFDMGLTFRLFLEAGNIHLMGEYVRRVLGISMVLAPEGGLELFPGELDYVPMDHIFPPESVRICCRKEAPLSPMVRLFLETVLEGVNPPGGKGKFSPVQV